MSAGLIDQTVPRIVCTNEAHLLALLRKNGPLTGKLSEKPDFIYRGQTDRSFRLCSPIQSVKEVQMAGAMMQDSLHPTEHRANHDSLAPMDTVPKGLQVECSENLSYLRTILAHLVLDRYVHATVPSGVADWIQAIERKKTSDPADYIVGLAQYCGFKTGHIDCTSSARIALWFATHTPTGDYLARGVGYVYQIELSKLDRAERMVNKARGRAAINPCRHIDLRSTPESLTVRPRAQHGWSLIQTDGEALMRELIALKGIVLYEFKRSPKVSQENQLGLRELGFVHEPLAELFRRYAVNASTHMGLQDWVNRNLNAVLPPTGQLNLSDRQWVRLLHRQASVIQDAIKIS